MKKVFLTLLALSLLTPAVYSQSASKQEDTTMKSTVSYFTNPEGNALDGYDAVSYFSGSPVKGDKSYSYRWQNAMWLFANAANQKAFTASPERYAPQYGGGCTMGMNVGKWTHASATAWEVKDGKLYLFQHGVAKFAFKIFGTFAKADSHWSKGDYKVDK